MAEDIIGQKVKKVLIVVELENGNALVANPTEIGKIDELVTLKELQKALGNSENEDKFLSPFVFALDLQDAGRRWIEELDKAYEDLESDNDWIELMIRETSHRGSWGRDVLSRWIKMFFNLDGKDD